MTVAFLSVETLDPVLISHLLDFSPVPKDNVAREPLPMIDPTCKGVGVEKYSYNATLKKKSQK
jgi:hypothetical protein